MRRNELRAAIAKKGLTQGEVARLIGMSPKTFSCKMKTGVFGTDEAMKMINLLDIKNPASIFLTNE